ncbi:MAG: tripartite tricarboxylate transporter substrate binding protein [Betaproteobacteria bacterium]|nr:tripartite tricarboxylate transporter substrate binding protein [Betaproteobacteria bacterium]
MFKSILFCAVIAASLGLQAADAQVYPARAVKVIVPLGAGGASDVMTRIVAQRLSEVWGQPVVVENQPGANAIIGTTALTKSPPDGYTLLVLAVNHVINPSLHAKLPYDTLRDVKPILRMGYTPFLLATHPSLPVKTLSDFIALAKKHPGKLNYGSAGVGSPSHLAGEFLKSMAGINIVHVAYKAIGTAQIDAVGGHLDFIFSAPSFAIPHIQSGRLRALGVSSTSRLSQLPQVPTIEEAGIRGFEVLSWIGLAGPAGTPDEIVNKIAADTMRVIEISEIRKRIVGTGLEVAPMPPAEFQDYVVQERAKWAKAMQQAGVKAE